MATTQARSIYFKDVATRRWNTSHGGVYVPVSATTPPNPHLAVQDRDIDAPSGPSLTLLNPAYMTRQIHELEFADMGTIGHITSLEPIRPENRADGWERAALEAFEQGSEEVHSLETIDGVQYMRLMRPLLTEAGCLECHADQGYDVGDIRGGISVAVPMAPLWAIGRPQLIGEVVVHSLAWLIGLGGLGVAIRRLARQSIERQRLKMELERLATTDPLTGAGDDDDTLDDLLRRADEALYEAKRQGRDRVVSA